MSDFDDDDPIDKGGVEPDAGQGGGSQPADDDWDDDWDDDDAGPGGGRRDMTLIVVIAVAVAVIALVVILTRPKDDDDVTAGATTVPAGPTTSSGDGYCRDWPGKVGGDGKNVSKGEGVYIWSDFEGWHIRSNRTDQIVVKITAPAPVKVKSKGNAISTADEGTDISLTIPAGDGKRGPDLDLNCEVTTATFEVSAAGNPVPPQAVTLGGGTKADANPVTFARGQP